MNEIIKNTCYNIWKDFTISIRGVSYEVQRKRLRGTGESKSKNHVGHNDDGTNGGLCD